MVSGLVKSMERSTNLIITCRYFHKERCKNNFIANINSQVRGSLYCPPSMTKTRVKRIMLACVNGVLYDNVGIYTVCCLLYDNVGIYTVCCVLYDNVGIYTVCCVLYDNVGIYTVCCLLYDNVGIYTVCCLLYDNVGIYTVCCVCTPSLTGVVVVMIV
jgi:hypothetical protein